MTSASITLALTATHTREEITLNSVFEQVAYYTVEEDEDLNDYEKILDLTEERAKKYYDLMWQTNDLDNDVLLLETHIECESPDYFQEINLKNVSKFIEEKSDGHAWLVENLKKAGFENVRLYPVIALITDY